MKYPRFYAEWPTLAKVAARLLADREAGYPGQVERGRMTQADADAGIRTMRAVAELWRRVVEREPVVEDGEETGTLGAWHYEMRADLTRTAARAKAIADADPTDDYKVILAECIEALAWNHQPTSGRFSDPIIMWIAKANAMIRDRAAREAAPMPQDRAA